MSEQVNSSARERATLVSKYVAILFGNLCAISAIYFAVRNDFLMPQTAQVTGIWFLIWVVIMVFVHFVVRPLLEKRFGAQNHKGGYDNGS